MFPRILCARRRSGGGFVLENLKSGCHRPQAASYSAGSPDEAQRPLDISLPDLKPHETAYIRQQVGLIKLFTPDHLLHRQWDHVKAVVRTDYPSFLTGDATKPGERLYRRLSRSVILAKRTSSALLQLGISQEEVQQTPQLLLYSLTSLPRDCEVKFLLDVPLAKVVRHRTKDPLRGKLIRDLVDDIVNSMQQLELLPDDNSASEIFNNLQWSPRQCGVLTIKELNMRAIRAIVTSTFPEEVQQESLHSLFINSDEQKQVHLTKAGRRAPSGSFSAKNLIRNFWLLRSLLGVDEAELLTPRALRLMGFNMCPLESLIMLNDFYMALSRHDEMLTPSAFLRHFSKANTLHLLYRPSLRLPLSLRVQMLRDIGFSSDECVSVLFSRNKNFSEVSYNNQSEAHSTHKVMYTCPTFIPTMRRRLELIREDGLKLGLSSPVEMFAAITHWKSLLNSLKKITSGGKISSNDKLCLHHHHSFVENAIVQLPPSYKQTAISHPAFKFLVNYFDVGKNERSAFREEVFVNPNQKSVSFGQVLTTLKYLEKEGFTKAQLRKAAPLLFYPTSIIRETLAEMEHLNSEKEADYFLQMCLYFVEREFQFSGDGFFVDYKPQLSEALSKEILRAGGAVTRDETRMEEHQKYGGIPHGGILGETLIASRRNHFDSWNKQSIIRQFSTSCGSRHKLWGISLRNPLEVIKVNSAFLKLRNEWDPSMDQEAFVEATKEAVSTVTHLLRDGQYQDLRGLISRKELSRLKTEIETQWDDVKRNNVAVEVNQVMDAFPRSVFRHHVGSLQRFCDVEMTFECAHERGHFTIDARFTREYTKGRLPDWIITRIKIK